MQKCKNHKKYTNKNSLAPAISIKKVKQNKNAKGKKIQKSVKMQKRVNRVN